MVGYGGMEYIYIYPDPDGTGLWFSILGLCIHDLVLCIQDTGFKIRWPPLHTVPYVHCLLYTVFSM